MPCYVILEHDHPFLHWDLMLEHGSTLRTWRLLAPLIENRDVPAQALGNHRPVYLDYEGPVSEGRGHVTRWDCGQYTIRTWSEKRVGVRLEGARSNGFLTLVWEDRDCWRALLSPGSDSSEINLI